MQRHELDLFTPRNERWLDTGNGYLQTQSIGLKDALGKDVYTGDIMIFPESEHPEPTFWVVRLLEGDTVMSKVSFNKEGDIDEIISDWNDYIHEDNPVEDGYIVGHVYQNASDFERAIRKLKESQSICA